MGGAEGNLSDEFIDDLRLRKFLRYQSGGLGHFFDKFLINFEFF